MWRGGRWGVWMHGDVYYRSYGVYALRKGYCKS
jgi:hypothetical protein